MSKVDRAALAQMMKTAEMGTADAARMCGVDRRTVQRWLAGSRRVPYAAAELMRVLTIGRGGRKMRSGPGS